MATMYNTSRGPTWDPMVVEIWPWDGDGPVGRLELSEKIEVTWADRGSGTVLIESPLTDLTRSLIPADGAMLVVVNLNGKRHVSSVVEAVPFAESDQIHDVRIRVATASPWSMLEGQLIPPVPDQPLSLQQSAEEFVLTGPVETVVKRLVQLGAARLGHPIQVQPDTGRGPTVTVRSRNDSVSDLVDKALAGTGYRLRLDAWLPGDGPVGDLPLTRPTIIADVQPYRRQPGLVWSARAEELEKWQLRHTRATATRMIVGDKGEKTAQKFVEVVADDEPGSPWARREGYTSASSDGDDLQQVGLDELAKTGPVVSADIAASPAAVWEFGSDGLYPRQYDVGDYASVELEGIGSIEQVITEVTATLTPVSLTVVPKVATPDTRERDLYSTVLDLDKRLGQQQRR
ncbi:Gp37-like protein [Corynebacterium heidelbergense]|uniref:Gp28/Gp37-like domain-containing protein n=1 Tax=Corynebacterium heidelbergense TaxID=2055947 RepID=A0A364VCA5_9CORY|nr:hypothetical protein [Corynebacterium heidelbergense]RAV34261.1 hypothetical protein CWC39_04210 [Corynebacterium heidelbergense]WCZ36967.1 hypothetical protein CHEID_07170 [Corynebacterium heidelbergense]